MTYRFPPPDATLSPWTGYTRAHWEAAADHLLDSVVPYAAPGFARFRLPGRTAWAGEDSDGLEGFARTFLLAAFRIAGAQGRVPPALIERYAEGLAAGTSPGNPYAWPEITDRSQPIVEAASIAIALHETRPWLFDALDPGTRERIVSWLSGAIGAAVPPCNWVLFPVAVQQFLAGVGGPYRQEEIDAALERIEEWYAGEGWYSDGPGQHYDYYVGWAMHLYPLLWARMADTGKARELAEERYRPRLRRFLADYQHFFAADGAPVHQGRSLTYRFATTAPLWLGALADATPLPPGRTRRIAGSVLRHFAEHGAPDEEGLLRLGWYHEYLPATQLYSGPASPYWASKAFLGLLLPADHPVWTAAEEPGPVDGGDQTLAVAPAGWLLHTTAHDGVVRLVNHGSDHAPRDPEKPGEGDPHYVRFGYATHTAPETALGAGGPGEAWTAGEPEGAVDGRLVLTAPDGTRSRRRRIERIGMCERFAASSCTDEVGGGSVTVESASVLMGAWEIRVHRVAAPAGYEVREGGYALAGQEPPAAGASRGEARARCASGLASAIVGLAGWGEADVLRSTGSNACGPHSATPFLGPVRHPGGVRTYVCAVAFGTGLVSGKALQEEVGAAVDGDTVTLHRTSPEEDEETIEVRLGERPAFTLHRGGETVLSWSGGPEEGTAESG